MAKQLSAFFCVKEGIERAYSEECRESLFGYLDFLPDYYTQESFKNKTNLEALKNVSYIFSSWGMPVLTKEEIERYLPNLKAVFYGAGTVQSFARPFLEKGIKVFSAWGANAVPVAEVTVSEIILANKGFFHTVHNASGDEWTEHGFGSPFTGNYGGSVGIIGAGMIGTLVIQMLKNYNLKVKVFDPFLSDEKARLLGVEKAEKLPDLFRECKVISNHLANNPQTVGMIDKFCFNNMQKNGVFINTGRGQQVVESDMINALKEDKTRIAVLDVTYPEPPEKGSELYKMKNVYLTPHMAGSLGDEVARMGEYMRLDFLNLIENKETKYEVSMKMLETMA